VSPPPERADRREGLARFSLVSGSPSGPRINHPMRACERRRCKRMGNPPRKGEQRMLNFFTRAYIALKDRSEGQAMVEYALILALISVVAVGVLATIGTDVNDTFSKIEAKF